MKKMILLTAVLGCSALWAGAQQSGSMPDAQSGSAPSASSSAQSGAGTSAGARSGAGQAGAGQTVPSTSAGNPVSVEGCLAVSGENYTLKDKASGVTYKLAGDTAKLAPYAEKELQLTGTTTAGAGAASPTSTGNAGGNSMPTLNMMSGKASSTACSAQ